LAASAAKALPAAAVGVCAADAALAAAAGGACAAGPPGASVRDTSPFNGSAGA